jgi:pre-rRNA-processing protein IPI1
MQQKMVHNLSGRELWKCTLDEDNSGSRAFAMSNILMKLQNLFQILVNSVEVSVSELFAKSTIDAQSSEALLSALHCLDLICNICIQEVKKPQMKFGRSKIQVGPEWLKSSVLVYAKKLWGVNRSFHEKVSISSPFHFYLHTTGMIIFKTFRDQLIDKICY